MPNTICPLCQQEHDYTPGTNAGRKCAPCFRGENAKRLREYMRARRAVLSCEDCSVALPVVYGKGKRRSRCPECHRAHLHKLDTIRYYERRRQVQNTAQCSDCGVVFDRPGKGGPIPRYCPECAAPRARDRDRAHGMARHARKRSLPNEFIPPSEIYERDNWTCGLCSQEIDKALRWPNPRSPSIDHIRPLSRDGHHVRENVQAAHLICNLRKSNTYELEAVNA